jgi:hypothetical protein
MHNKVKGSNPVAELTNPMKSVGGFKFNLRVEGLNSA